MLISPTPRRAAAAKAAAAAAESAAVARTASARIAAATAAYPAAASAGTPGRRHGVTEHGDQERDDAADSRQRQRGCDEPEITGNKSTGRERTEQPAEYPSKNAAGNERREDEERIEQVFEARCEAGILRPLL